MINIGIGIGWAKALYSVANNVIANFKARVLSYPNSIFEAGPCLDATLEELNAIGLLDNASLVITPNAYTEGILYDVVPNTTLGDMTVVRATTATRVNSAGLIEVVPRNLFTYSEEFNNADWSKFQATVTANNTTAPNGTLTADKLESSANGTAVLFRTASTGAGVSTISVYAKAGTNDILDIGFTNVSDFTVKANLTTGTITSATSGITGTITSVGNGWYRVTATRTMTASGTGFINSATSISGRFIYIWGGQLDLGNATEYFPTTTRLNIPRIDYTNGSCPSLLVEPQRTNILTYSEALTPNYTFNQCSITSNQISPNGTNNAKRITNGATATDVYFEQSVGITLNSYTWSAFVKKGTDNSATIKPVHVGIGGDVSLMTFTFATETIVTSGAITTSGFTKLTNGWYRIFCTVPITLAVISLRGRFGNSNTANVYNEWYGVQLEVGSYPTSYIPTVASTVTRNADVISKTGISSLIGQTEGVLFTDFVCNGFQNFGTPLSVNNSSTSNNIWITTFANGNIRAELYNGAVQTSITYTGGVIGQRYKLAFAYKTNDFAMYVNGSLVGTDVSGTTFSGTTLSRLDFDLGNSTVYSLSLIKINQAILFKTRLTNSELAQLTTL